MDISSSEGPGHGRCPSSAEVPSLHHRGRGQRGFWVSRRMRHRQNSIFGYAVAPGTCVRLRFSRSRSPAAAAKIQELILIP